MMTTLLQPVNGMGPVRVAARQLATRERGIALVVALVFLLMLTILGVAVMNTASLEGVMAGNSQETNRAFHGAESAIQNVFADKSYGTLVRQGDSKTSDPITYGGTSVTVITTYQRQTETAGRAKNIMHTHSEDYAKSIFDYQATAKNNVTRASTTVTNGKAVVTHKIQ